MTGFNQGDRDGELETIAKDMYRERGKITESTTGVWYTLASLAISHNTWKTAGTVNVIS